MVFQHVAEPNNSSLLENKVDWTNVQKTNLSDPIIKLKISSPKHGGCNNLTHGKAVFNNKENGFHLLAKPRVVCSCNQFEKSKSFSQAGGCNVLIHGKAVFNNKENGCHLLAKPNGSNVLATNLNFSKINKTLEAVMT